jgi:hypothetical protein
MPGNNATLQAFIPRRALADVGVSRSRLSGRAAQVVYHPETVGDLARPQRDAIVGRAAVGISAFGCGADAVDLCGTDAAPPRRIELCPHSAETQCPKQGLSIDQGGGGG